MGEEYEKESIKDKRATCIRILKNINFILIQTRRRIALLRNHDDLIHTSVRLNAVFNPMKRFLNMYVNGVDPLNQQVEFLMSFVSMFHTEILFRMTSIEFASNCLQKYVQCSLMYKRLDLLCTIASKCSKSLQSWAVKYKLWWNENVNY